MEHHENQMIQRRTNRIPNDFTTSCYANAFFKRLLDREKGILVVVHLFHALRKTALQSTHIKPQKQFKLKSLNDHFNQNDIEIYQIRPNRPKTESPPVHTVKKEANIPIFFSSDPSFKIRGWYAFNIYTLDIAWNINKKVWNNESSFCANM